MWELRFFRYWEPRWAALHIRRGHNTQAVVALIQEADTDGWEKHQLDRGGSFGDAADQFYAAIFGAVARHAAQSGMWPEGMTVAELLREMIDNLVAKGRLMTTITDSGERDQE